MWRLVSATLCYRWLVVALAWGTGVFAGLQIGLQKPDNLAVAIGFTVVVASAIAGIAIAGLEQRERRGLLVPLLVVSRSHVAAARAVTPMAVLALGSALGVCLSALDAALRGKPADLDVVLAPIAVAAQLAPYMQIALIAVEVKVAHDEARRGSAHLGSLILLAGLALPLAVNLGALAERWVACGIAGGVGVVLTVAAGSLYRRRLRFAE